MRELRGSKQMRSKSFLNSTHFLFPPFTTVARLSGALPFVWLHLRTSHDGHSIDHAAYAVWAFE
jgi:hypothetical protein